MTHINPPYNRKSNIIKIKPKMQHNNTKYNILQWNLNGFYKRSSDLQIIINKYCPEIICLQETNFTNYKKTH
jgi:mRNA deadenylase 3'-5' endonuclease subunit Ccr4